MKLVISTQFNPCTARPRFTRTGRPPAEKKKNSSRKKMRHAPLKFVLGAGWELG